MNYELISKLVGNMLKIQASFMIVPLIVAFAYKEGDAPAFFFSIIITASAGFLLALVKPRNKNFTSKDAFAAAAFSWILFSIFGAVPFYLSGSFNSIADCIFESVSGFTTTGSTILSEIESMPKGILFWRSFSHWMGGMGVLLFMLAVIPSMNASAINLLRAESTGPSPNRVVPRVRETAKIMYIIYVIMTAVLLIFLLISGLPLYDSLIHTFSTAGTGGFSNMNQSVGAYNNTMAEIVIGIFMFLFGISFTLYFYLFKKNFKQAFNDEELRFYFGIVAVSIILITINISGLYNSLFETLRHSSFQVISVISTAGFSTADFSSWPPLSQFILIVLMVTGCCAGSTGGGIKLIRFLLLIKAAKLEVDKIIYPKSVRAIMINKKKTDNDIVAKTAMFFFIYFIVFAVATILVSLEGKGTVTNITAVMSSIGNVGPGLDMVGPYGNYSAFNSFSKIILSICMLAGRLEFLPVLMLFNPSAWRRKMNIY